MDSANNEIDPLPEFIDIFNKTTTKLLLKGRLHSILQLVRSEENPEYNTYTYYSNKNS